MRHDEDNNNDDGNTPLRSRASTETVGGDSIVAGDGYLQSEEGRSFIRYRTSRGRHNFCEDESAAESRPDRAYRSNLWTFSKR
jgi:hypothetical protein